MLAMGKSKLLALLIFPIFITDQYGGTRKEETTPSEQFPNPPPKDETTPSEEFPNPYPKEETTPSEEFPNPRPKDETTPLEQFPNPRPKDETTPSEEFPNPYPKEETTPSEEFPNPRPKDETTPSEQFPNPQPKEETTPSEQFPNPPPKDETTPSEQFLTPPPKDETTPSEQFPNPPPKDETTPSEQFPTPPPKDETTPSEQFPNPRPKDETTPSEQFLTPPLKDETTPSEQFPTPPSKDETTPSEQFPNPQPKEETTPSEQFPNPPPKDETTPSEQFPTPPPKDETTPSEQFPNPRPKDETTPSEQFPTPPPKDETTPSEQFPTPPPKNETTPSEQFPNPPPKDETTPSEQFPTPPPKDETTPSEQFPNPRPKDETTPSEQFPNLPPKDETTPSEEFQNPYPKEETTPSEEFPNPIPKDETTPLEQFPNPRPKDETTPSEEFPNPYPKEETTPSEEFPNPRPKDETTPSEQFPNPQPKEETTPSEQFPNPPPKDETTPSEQFPTPPPKDETTPSEQFPNPPPKDETTPSEQFPTPPPKDETTPSEQFPNPRPKDETTPSEQFPTPPPKDETTPSEQFPTPPPKDETTPSEQFPNPQPKEETTPSEQFPNPPPKDETTPSEQFPTPPPKDETTPSEQFPNPRPKDETTPSEQFPTPPPKDETTPSEQFPTPPPKDETTPSEQFPNPPPKDETTPSEQFPTPPPKDETTPSEQFPNPRPKDETTPSEQFPNLPPKDETTPSEEFPNPYPKEETTPSEEFPNPRPKHETTPSEQFPNPQPKEETTPSEQFPNPPPKDETTPSEQFPNPPPKDETTPSEQFPNPPPKDETTPSEQFPTPPPKEGTTPSTTILDPNNPTTTLDPNNPTTTLDPNVPTTTLATTTLDPNAPTTTMDPNVPTTTMDPNVPTTTLDPNVPTTTLDPNAPTTTLDPSDPTTTMVPNAPTTPLNQNAPTRTLNPDIPTTILDPSAPSTTSDFKITTPAKSLINNHICSKTNYTKLCKIVTESNGLCKHYFLHDNIKTSMVDAANECESCGGRLAVVKTKEEHDKLLNCFMPFIVRAYVGIKDVGSYNEPYENGADSTGALGQLTADYFHHFVLPDDATKQCASYNMDGMIEEDYCTGNNRHYVCETKRYCADMTTTASNEDMTIKNNGAIATTTSSCPSQVYTSQCEIASESGHVCKQYFIHKEMKTSMVEAANVCESCGGRLAIVKTKEEHNKLLNCFMPFNVRAYVGLKDVGSFNVPYGYRWLENGADLTGVLGQLTATYFDHFVLPDDVIKQCASYNLDGQIQEDYCTSTNRYYICEQTKLNDTGTTKSGNPSQVTKDKIDDNAAQMTSNDITTISLAITTSMCLKTNTDQLCEVVAEYGDMCKHYFIHKDLKTSMVEAANVCEICDGRLAVIKTDNHHNKLLQCFMPFSERAYVGLKDIGSYNEPYGYRWLSSATDSTGTLGQLTAEYFRHFVSPINLDKQCASYNLDGMMEEDDCSETSRHFICERTASCVLMNVTNNTSASDGFDSGMDGSATTVTSNMSGAGISATTAANHPSRIDGTYYDCWREKSDTAKARLQQNSIDPLCSCLGMRMKIGNTCQFGNVAQLDIRVSLLCQYPLEFTDDLKDPANQKFKDLASILIYGLYTMRDSSNTVLSTTKQFCVYPRSMKPGSAVTEILVEVSDNHNADQAGQALADALAGTSGIVGASGAVAHQIQNVDECTSPTLNDCDQNAICYDTFGSFSCQCKEEYEDSSSVNDRNGTLCVVKDKCKGVWLGNCCCPWWLFILLLLLLILLLLLLILSLSWLCCKICCCSARKKWKRECKVEDTESQRGLNSPYDDNDEERTIVTPVTSDNVIRPPVIIEDYAKEYDDDKAEMNKAANNEPELNEMNESDANQQTEENESLKRDGMEESNTGPVLFVPIISIPNSLLEPEKHGKRNFIDHKKNGPNTESIDNPALQETKKRGNRQFMDHTKNRPTMDTSDNSDTVEEKKRRNRKIVDHVETRPKTGMPRLNGNNNTPRTPSSGRFKSHHSMPRTPKTPVPGRSASLRPISKRVREKSKPRDASFPNQTLDIEAIPPSYAANPKPKNAKSHKGDGGKVVGPKKGKKAPPPNWKPWSKKPNAFDGKTGFVDNDH